MQDRAVCLGDNDAELQMGIIARSAVRRFLKRSLDDFRPYKTFSERKLADIADDLEVKPPIFYRLNKDQKICFVIGAVVRRFAFWADTGTGKTLLSIALVLFFRRLGILKRVIVLVPAKINKWEWRREVRKWAPKAGALVLKGSSAQKWEALENSKAPFVIETYGGFVRMVTKAKKNKKGKNKLAINPTLRKRLLAQFQGIIMDESIMVMQKKKRGSLIFRLCLAISAAGKVAFALNGTPHGRDPTDLYGQMKAVDLGETLGPTLGLFRAAFFDEKPNFWGGAEYKFKKKMWPVLNRMLAHRSLRIEANESDLPPVVLRKATVNLPVEAEELYEEAKSELIAAHGNIRDMNNAFTRLRQISSGFVGYYDDETGSKAKYEFENKPKLDMLCSLADRVADRHKFIVFHDFVYSGDMIERELKNMGIGFLRVRGDDEQETLLDRYDNDKKVRGIIINNYEGYGLNLQTASYGFYYESPPSVVKRKQTQRRFIRQHSKHKRVWLWDLVTAGTYDERILKFHKQGADLFEAIVNGRAAA